MPSQESQALKALYRRINGLLASPGLNPDFFGIVMEETATVSAEPTDVTYEEVQCPGTVRPAIWCKPLSASPSRVILYIHGGGFSGGSPACHRKMVAHLAKRARCHAIVIDYRRSPEHQFPKQIDDVLATYDWLVKERGFTSKHIAFAGDSAGGNLTVAASLAARNRGLEVPASIVAFSPWIDMKLTSKTYQTHAHTDALVIQEAMQGLVGAYVGDASLEDPLIDLIHADLKGLPPMYITVGTAEVLHDDATRLADNARSAGVEVHLELEKDMQHVWVFMAGTAPEADSSLARAAEFIRGKF
ncbi:Alpha/beta hydrolase fold-3 domain protein [Dactylonectria macrodidyma]|uniref:Alpha/beta hydrolase fold-3 domain protein n=1 Tax=Dactylonectria macrodidyma TaxID=307937 RepID=A0A9P9EQ77_9HYPO|nr:Alpha/beta hydrolase fold-3 domain protein [Dactylonectria macrodidyma]